jgi:nucleoside 2-deoxyribosyltransferase
VTALYVASPLGFSEAGCLFYRERLLPLLKHGGFEVLDPWALTDPAAIERVRHMSEGAERRRAWQQLNAEIGATNRWAIERADGVVAVLDGVDVDSGTAAEVGFAFGLGKRIVGYRGDVRLSADNEGALVNLQVEHFIRTSGGEIVTRLDDLPAVLARVFP